MFLGEALTLSTGCKRTNTRKKIRMKWHDELYQQLGVIMGRLDALLRVHQLQYGVASRDDGDAPAVAFPA